MKLMSPDFHTSIMNMLQLLTGNAIHSEQDMVQASVYERDLDTNIKSILWHLQRLQVVFLFLLKVYKTTLK